MVRAIEELGALSLRDKNSLLRWATEVARNQIRKEVRRKREESLERLFPAENRKSDTGPSTPSAEASKREELVRLVEMLEKLPEGQFRVIELRSLEELTFPEVAARMGRTENAVRLLHVRAVARLGEMLRP